MTLQNIKKKNGNIHVQKSTNLKLAVESVEELSCSKESEKR